MTRFLIPALLFLLTACGQSIYDKVEPGKFTGTLMVMWVGPGDLNSGDGKFIYVPTNGRGKALSFQRPRSGKDDSLKTLMTINPQWMYTDGGSIPRNFQAFRGLNPWGYAPAFMVHDWIFVARKCLNADMADDMETATENLTFRDSYVIMAEAIKALENRFNPSDSKLPPRAISWAVSLGISRRIWEDGIDCTESKPTPDEIKKVEARLGIGPASRLDTVMVDGERISPADVVAQIEF